MCFLFFKQKTAYELRISDWSSDVCSSDLADMNDHNDCASGLTCREYQILELVAQGFSAKEVAQRIDIAPRTVERHIDNVRLKLQARNRTHMVAKAIAANLLTPEGEKVRPVHEDRLVVRDRKSTRLNSSH